MTLTWVLSTIVGGVLLNLLGNLVLRAIGRGDEGSGPWP